MRWRTSTSIYLKTHPAHRQDSKESPQPRPESFWSAGINLDSNYKWTSIKGRPAVQRRLLENWFPILYWILWYQWPQHTREPTWHGFCTSRQQCQFCWHRWRSLHVNTWNAFWTWWESPTFSTSPSSQSCYKNCMELRNERYSNSPEELSMHEATRINGHNTELLKRNVINMEKLFRDFCWSST